MPVDPEDLAATALSRSGPLPEGLGTHQTTELHALRRAVDVGRGVTPADMELADPPADLWERIAAGAFDAADGGRRTAKAVPATGESGGTDVAPVVVDLRARRNRNRGLVLAAAAAVTLLAGIVGLSTRSGDPADELVASVDLQVVAGDGHGTAELRQRAGGLHLVVDVADLRSTEPADFFELWLLTPEGGDPQPLHKFTETSGIIEVPLPDGVDPDRFPVVDISEELDDGDDSHSGLSILRGSLA